MTEKERLLLKCIEALSSMICLVAVAIDANGALDSDAFYRAYGKYNAAHYDLLHCEDES